MYKFDRKLRLLVFDAIERIEIAVRTQVIHQLSLKYGAHWQDQKVLFMPPKINRQNGKIYDVYADIQKHINDQLSANKRATFIEHYMNTYNDPPTPPSRPPDPLLLHREAPRSHCSRQVSQNPTRRYLLGGLRKGFSMN
ncbi:MAG: Abi family protein [Bacteroidaceae bacterium]|nr:Abi family protein [Bacteroidaceae bacterium]